MTHVSHLFLEMIKYSLLCRKKDLQSELKFEVEIMKYFLILCIISEISSIPIYDSRIIYPDEFSNIQIDNRIDDTELDQINLLNDPNILKPANSTTTLAKQHQERHKNPENGNFFQGDIVLMDEELNSFNDSSKARTGLSSILKRWPKNLYGKVVIPFTMSDDFCKFMK